MEVVLHLPVVPNVELVAAKAVETLGRALEMHQTRVEAVSVATVEACLNAMEHGGGQMIIRLRDEDQDTPLRLVVEVEDHGDGFDPKASPGANDSRKHGCTTKRGWGLTLIRELMDEVQILSQPGKTLVRMWKYVESAP
jgi:anti-sigma regulatory factor (Ser/Thr protein kinase)